MKLQQTTLRTIAFAFTLQRGFVSAFASPSFSAAATRTIASTALYSKMDQSFPTWSYDKPCLSMEWSSVVEAELSVAEYSKSAVDDSDLVLVGVMAPRKEEEDEEDEEGKDPEVAPLSGTALALDEQLGGALSEIMAENAKTFKNGAKMGGKLEQ